LYINISIIQAFVSYVRSVYLQQNKDMFDVSALPLAQFAESLGLPGAPKVKFVKKYEKNAIRVSKSDPNFSDEDDSSGEATIEKKVGCYCIKIKI
jgi:ATP-dependent RNA helicase DDX10/DBP4